MKDRVKTRLIQLADRVITVAILLGTLGLFSYGCYAIWDANTVVSASMPDKYQKYKPGKSSLSLEELQRENPDVLGWIQVYGTNIDYPLLQGENNDKYLSRDAKGAYSLSGGIFLDYRNDRSFQDFNHIIYGHHMEYHTMFGDISEFKDKDFFESHRYGRLYYGGRDWGIEFFAFLEEDAYNTFLYNPGIKEKEARQKYLEDIYRTAVYSRKTDVTGEDRLVLLSTCTTNLTNGRHILAGRLTEEVVREEKEKKAGIHPYVEVNREIVSMWILVAGIAVMVGWVVAIKIRSVKRREKMYEKRSDL